MMRKTLSKRERAAMKQLPTVGTLSSEILSFSSINQNFDSTAPSAKRPRTASKSTKGKKGKGKGKKGKDNISSNPVISRITFTQFIYSCQNCKCDVESIYYEYKFLLF